MDDANSRREASAWQATLSKSGYIVILQIVRTVPQVTEVRYYRRSDAKEAAQIGEALSGVKAQPKYLVGFENSTAVRPRHFEVWIAVPSAPTL
jgi:hypothetical protein